MSENHPTDKASQPDGQIGEPKTPNDGWAKVDRKIQIISPILIPFVIALMGYWGQKTITEISVQEQNSRLYTELLSRREESESALRKDMFKEIMNGFFTEITVANQSGELISEGDKEYKGEDIKDKLSKKILKLEMLALNFGDSLSIGPLFNELSDDIEHVLKANANVIDNWMVVAAPYQKRLRGLAKRVASRQMSTISAGSETPDKFEFKITAKLKIEVEDCQLQEDTGEEACKKRIKNIEKDSGTNDDFYWSSMDADFPEDKLQLDGVTRYFEITLRDADLMSHTISVNMKILEMSEGTFIPQVVADRNFSMDFFNFPLIDNTRLSNNHRFALIIEDFDHKTIELKGVLFPGSFASHRDKPFLNDAINELKINKDNE